MRRHPEYVVQTRLSGGAAKSAAPLLGLIDGLVCALLVLLHQIVEHVERVFCDAERADLVLL